METEFVNKRRFKRVKFEGPVHYRFKEQGKFGGCLARDISEGGIKLSFENFVPINTEMTIQVKLENIASIVDLTGHVAWVQQVPYSDRYRIGLEFAGTNPFIRSEIQSFVGSRRF